jgi:hypothetical protein
MNTNNPHQPSASRLTTTGPAVTLQRFGLGDYFAGVAATEEAIREAAREVVRATGGVSAGTLVRQWHEEALALEKAARGIDTPAYTMPDWPVQTAARARVPGLAQQALDRVRAGASAVDPAAQRRAVVTAFVEQFQQQTGRYPKRADLQAVGLDWPEN